MSGLSAYQKWQMCDRKKAYDTSKAANKTARKHGHRAYMCPVCGRWHVTKHEQQ